MLKKNKRFKSTILVFVLVISMMSVSLLNVSAEETAVCANCGNSGQICTQCEEYCSECALICPDCGWCEHCNETGNYVYCNVCGGCEFDYQVCIRHDGCSNCTRVYDDGCSNCALIPCPSCGENTGVNCVACDNYCTKCTLTCPACYWCSYCNEENGYEYCKKCGGCASCFALCPNKDGCNNCSEVYQNGCSNCEEPPCPSCKSETGIKCSSCKECCSECSLLCAKCGRCRDCTEEQGYVYCTNCGGCSQCYEVVKHKTSCGNCFTTNPFSDVFLSDWFYLDVSYVCRNGLMTGYSNSTKFGPSDVMNRAMFATVLYRIEGKPEITGGKDFPDVEKGSYYEDAVKWASSAGVVSGYANGYYGPNDSITREQMAAMMYRYAIYKGYESGGEPDRTKYDTYEDRCQVQDWAEKAMIWAVSKNIISGKGGKWLDPGGKATRAECAAILHRFDVLY